MNQRLISLATVAVLMVLVALPLLFIVLQAVFPQFSAGSLQGAFSGLRPLFSEPQLPAMFAGTLQIAAGVALLSACIGLPLGVARGLFDLPCPRMWDLLFLIPFLTPPYIAALSWMLVLQTNGYLAQLLGFDLNVLLFSKSGIVLVMTLNIFPVVYFAVSRSLLASGQRLALVARVHGATPWRAFWHVTLPMLSPSLAAGMLLAFTLAIEEYGVPAALGTRSGVVMLTVGIEKKLADWPIDLPGASMLSLILIVIALSAWWLQGKLTGGKDVTSVTGKPTENMGAKLGIATVPVVGAMAFTGFLAVLVPGLSMAITGVMSTLSGGLSLANATTAHYVALFAQQGDALTALGTSLSLAFASALITGFVGLLAAWFVVVQRIKGRSPVADARRATGYCGGGGADSLVEPHVLARLAVQHLGYFAALVLLPVAALAGALCRECAASVRRESGASRPCSWRQPPAGIAFYCSATGLSGHAGGDADGFCYRVA